MSETLRRAFVRSLEVIGVVFHDKAEAELLAAAHQQVAADGHGALGPE